MNDFVSIIIPEFEETDYLVRCMNALLRQTANHIEIIIAQTEFDEKNEAIIADYLEKHENIRLISRTGESAHSLNLAIKQSCGEYLLFVAVDEVLAPNAVEALLTEVEGTKDSICFNMAVKQENGLFSKLYPEDAVSSSVLLHNGLNLYNHFFQREHLLSDKLPFCCFDYLSEYLFLLQYHCTFPESRMLNQVFMYKDSMETLADTTLEEWEIHTEALQKLIGDYLQYQTIDDNFMLINQVIQPVYQLYDSLEESEQKAAFDLLKKLLEPYQNDSCYCGYIEALLNIRLNILISSNHSTYRSYIELIRGRTDIPATMVETKALKQLESRQNQITAVISELQSKANYIQDMVVQNQVQMAQEREELKQTLVGYVDIYDPATSVVNAFSQGKLGLKTVFRCFRGWLAYKLRRNK